MAPNIVVVSRTSSVLKVEIQTGGDLPFARIEMHCPGTVWSSWSALTEVEEATPVPTMSYYAIPYIISNFPPGTTMQLRACAGRSADTLSAIGPVTTVSFMTEREEIDSLHAIISQKQEDNAALMTENIGLRNTITMSRGEVRGSARSVDTMMARLAEKEKIIHNMEKKEAASKKHRNVREVALQGAANEVVIWKRKCDEAEKMATILNRKIERMTKRVADLEKCSADNTEIDVSEETRLRHMSELKTLRASNRVQEQQIQQMAGIIEAQDRKRVSARRAFKA